MDIAFHLSNLIPDSQGRKKILERQARWAGLWSNELGKEVESFDFMMQMGPCICEAAP
jgi:hypothetical protein